MQRSKALYMLFVAILFMTALSAADSPALAQYKMKTSVMGSAGSPASGTSGRLTGTLGQPSVIGHASDIGGSAFLGFWYGGDEATSTGAENTPPLQDRLYQNYPNPFNPATTITFSMSVAGRIELTIYNTNGQRVRTLLDEYREPGRQTVSWNGSNDAGRPVSSGIYFYRLRAGSYESVKKMVLLR